MTSVDTLADVEDDLLAWFSENGRDLPWRRTRDAYAISPEREGDRELVAPGVQVVIEGLERLVPGSVVHVDPDTSSLAPVPGMYRTGEQRIDRPEPVSAKGNR